MGLGKMFTRPASPTRPQSRTITEFATIDGEKTYGSGAELQTYKGGMSIPAAWRAALLVSDLLGSVPWDAYRERSGQPLSKVEPRPLLLDQPDDPHPRMATFSAWALDLVWHGNAFGLISSRTRDGWPSAVIPVPAPQVWARYRQGPPGPTLQARRRGDVEYMVNGRSYEPRDMLHVMGPHAPGALRGFGVLEAHLDGTLKLAAEQAKQAQSLSRHGVPTGLLKVSNPDATRDDLKDTKDSWLKAQDDRSVAVLNSTTEFEPLSWNPEELQLVEARKFSLHEIGLIFGVPLSFLGADQATRTYSNIEQEGLNLLKYSLAGHLARFEQTLSLHLPRNMWARANLDSILRGDTLSRYQAHQIGLDAGFLTVDEVRDSENMPPMPEPQPDPQALSDSDDDQQEGNPNE